MATGLPSGFGPGAVKAPMISSFVHRRDSTACLRFSFNRNSIFDHDWKLQTRCVFSAAAAYMARRAGRYRWCAARRQPRATDDKRSLQLPRRHAERQLLRRGGRTRQKRGEPDASDALRRCERMSESTLGGALMPRLQRSAWFRPKRLTCSYQGTKLRLTVVAGNVVQ